MTTATLQLDRMPQFDHDCPMCVFLGRVADLDQFARVDAYVCENALGGPGFVLRYGDEGADTTTSATYAAQLPDHVFARGQDLIDEFWGATAMVQTLAKTLYERDTAHGSYEDRRDSWEVEHAYLKRIYLQTARRLLAQMLDAGDRAGVELAKMAATGNYARGAGIVEERS